VEALELDPRGKDKGEGIREYVNDQLRDREHISLSDKQPIVLHFVDRKKHCNRSHSVPRNLI
jgi:hypothetical protein|tara:strand:+ start:1846 stop:2031 length:186 start_codon:yes stop_codon:yes gene_type:complete